MTVSRYNALLDLFMMENGFTCPIVFMQLILGRECDQWIVSLLGGDEEIVGHDHLEHVTGTVSRAVLFANIGDFKIPNGIVVQRMYSWGFADSITEDWAMLFDLTFTGKGLNRRCTAHEGSFEIFDQRKTHQASGSLVAAPGKTKEHHHLRSSFNRTTYTLAKSMLNKLGDETVAMTSGCGDSLMAIIQSSLDIRERGDVCPRLILSKGIPGVVAWFNYLHRDNDFGNKEATAKAMKLIQESGDRSACEYYLERYFQVTQEKNYCRATTCCWKLLEQDSEYSHRQFFVNATCRVAFNLSSNVFSHLDQIGCTFYGGLFGHCTSMPIYLSGDGRRVRIKPRGRNYNLAWGRSH